MDHHLSISSNSTLAGHQHSPAGRVESPRHSPSTQPRRVLKGIYCDAGRNRRIVFHYKIGRWNQFESLYPWDIREALQISLERVEEALPGSLERAANLDDENWLSSSRRTRRYIAERREFLYIESPHLQSQSQEVSGYYVTTNIPWRDVPTILRLLCQAARIEYQPLACLSF